MEALHGRQYEMRAGNAERKMEPMDNQAIKKLQADLWEAADLLRQGSKLTSQQYCMPVLGLLFLRYAYSRFKKVEA